MFGSGLLVRSRASLVLSGALSAVAVLATGCALNPTVPASGPVIDSAAIAGNVHGGQSPVYNATVTLYEAGYTGYGTGSTALATTTTDVNGNFAFTKNAGTATPGTTLTNTYACDTAKPTAQIYIIAQGGNTQGTGTTSTSNSASAFLSAIGQCNNISSGTRVILNELNTAATVYALAQYINPGSAVGGARIGTSSSAQGTVGLNNAVVAVSNLINIASGNLSGFNGPQYTGANASVSGITVTVTPDYPKLVDVANELASCVNQASVTSTTNCADLFNNATAPTPGNTSQPSATFTSAADTIQAAYYLATNPGLIGTVPTCNNNAGSTTRSACLYGLIASTAPFQSGTSTAPTDYTLGVNYTATGTCAGGSFIAGAYHAGVDANGNLWFINGTSSTATIAEMSPTGIPLFCGNPAFTAGAGVSGRGLTIDVVGNVWATYNGVTASGVTTLDGVVEVPVGSTTVSILSQPAAPPYEMTSDGFGNVFYTTNAAGGAVSEFVNGANATTPTATTAVAGPFNGTSTTTLGYVQADSKGRVWASTSSAAALYGLYPTSTAAITSVATDGSNAKFNLSTAPASGFTVGATVQIAGLTTTLGSNFNNGTYTISATGATSFSVASSIAANTSGTEAGTAYIPGAYTFGTSTTPSTGYGVAIDSGNNIYQGTTCCSGATFKELLRGTPATSTSTTVTYAASTNYLGGQNGVRSTVADGASNVFTGSEFPNSSGAGQTTGSFSITEINYNTAGSFVALSPTGVTPGTCSTTAGCPTTGGFFDSTSAEGTPYDMQIDPSGNLWVLDSGDYTSSTDRSAITELIGVAVPVVTPLSVAVKTGQLGTKP